MNELPDVYFNPKHIQWHSLDYLRDQIVDELLYRHEHGAPRAFQRYSFLHLDHMVKRLERALDSVECPEMDE